MFNFLSLKVLSSNEKSRAHTSSIEHNGLKKDFLELQSMRNEVLSFRPRGMFNPKYQKVFIKILFYRIPYK